MKNEKKQIRRARLNTGAIVLGNADGYSKTFVNRTQAQKAVDKLRAAGLSAEVLQYASNPRCFYAFLDKETARLKEAKRNLAEKLDEMAEDTDAVISKLKKIATIWDLEIFMADFGLSLNDIGYY